MISLICRIGENSSATVCYQPPLVETVSLLPAQSSSSSSSSSSASSTCGTTSDGSLHDIAAVVKKRRTTAGHSAARRRRTMTPGTTTTATMNEDLLQQGCSVVSNVAVEPPSAMADEPAAAATVRPARHTTITDRLPPNTFYRDPPNLYVFPGAEIWWDENSSSTEPSSSLPSSDDDEDMHVEIVDEVADIDVDDSASRSSNQGGYAGKRSLAVDDEVGDNTETAEKKRKLTTADAPELRTRLSQMVETVPAPSNAVKSLHTDDSGPLSTPPPPSVPQNVTTTQQPDGPAI